MSLPSAQPFILSVLVGVAASAAPIAPVSAQVSMSHLPDGSRVRVTDASGSVHVGIPADANTRARIQLLSSDDHLVSIPWDDVTRAEVEVFRSRAHGAVRGAGIGLLAGGLSGALLGAVAGGGSDSGGMCFGPCTRMEMGMVGAVLLGVPGFALGGLVGLANPGSTWEDINSRGRVSVAPVLSTTGVGARVGLAF